MKPRSRIGSDGRPFFYNPIGLAEVLMTAIAMFRHVIGRLASTEAPRLIDYVDRAMDPPTR